MEPATVSSCILTLHRRFAAYTTQRLQELGLSFGMMYFVIYVGKHPDCIWTGATPSAASPSWPRMDFSPKKRAAAATIWN